MVNRMIWNENRMLDIGIKRRRNKSVKNQDEIKNDVSFPAQQYLINKLEFVSTNAKEFVMVSAGRRVES